MTKCIGNITKGGALIGATLLALTVGPAGVALDRAGAVRGLLEAITG